jgi:hypothetical protein
MQYAQDFDLPGAQPIRHDVRRPGYNQFPRSFTPAGLSDFRETYQPRDCGQNAPDLIVSRRRVVVSNIGTRGGQVPKRRNGPD